jgi:hypothetical protein
MNRFARTLALGGCLALLAANKPTATSDRDEAVVLKGWHQLGPGEWTVDDAGVITGKQTKDKKHYGHLVSDNSYRDFKASLEFKCVKGNSGFYFHADPQGYEMHGIQAEIDELHNVGGLYESYRRNWVSQPKAEDVAKFFKPQEWNTMTVEATGDHIVVAVNGVVSADVVDPKGRAEGHFALQLHVGDGEVMFRNIKIEGEAIK